MIPDTLKYTKSHEWVLKLDDGAVRIGLTIMLSRSWAIWCLWICRRWATR